MVVCFVRVVAGQAKNRRLHAPPGLTTRPMTDRSKEALFSSVADHIPGAQVLDLFAGSGSLGLEALSRGAAQAVFVEKDRAALATLQENIAKVGLGGTVRSFDVNRFLADPPTGAVYDLVFVDPPYEMPVASVGKTLAGLVPLLAQTGLVLVHRRSGEPAPQTAGLVVQADRRYGSARVVSYQRKLEGRR